MRKVVISGMIGNGLEWYDYALYGQVAWLLGRLFFPSDDAAVQLLASFGVFAAGFLVRPLGAILFGWIGDKYGRKRAMVLAVLLMALPTGAIGLLPTYAEIGIAAPIILTLIRLLQGLSLGGEFCGSITYIVEHAPVRRRGIAGSASIVSLMLGFIAGLLVVRGAMAWLGTEEFEAWGWRIPFLIGIVIGFVGFYIRSHCSESPLYEEARKEKRLSQTPVRTAFTQHPWQMLQGFAIYLTVTMPFYLTTIYFISFSHVHLGLANDDALSLSVYNMLAMLAVIPVGAWLSDRIGRKRVMLASAFVILFSVYPLFSHFEAGRSVFEIGLVQFIFAFIIGMYMSPIAAILVELFPTSVRFTGMAIAYNISAALFGGTAPLVCEWLIKQTGEPVSIAFYVMACAVASITALFFVHDRYKDPLH